MGLMADCCIQFYGIFLIFLIRLSAYKICIISIKICIFGKFVELTLAKIPIYIPGTEVKAAFFGRSQLRLRNFLSISCLTSDRNSMGNQAASECIDCNVGI